MTVNVNNRDRCLSLFHAGSWCVSGVWVNQDERRATQSPKIRDGTIRAKTEWRDLTTKQTANGYKDYFRDAYRGLDLYLIQCILNSKKVNSKRPATMPASRPYSY